MPFHFACTVFLLRLTVLVSALLLDHRDFNASFLKCYDYIIVGGGVSGLVVANRLTEDPAVTVLVLESGDLDHSEDFISLPIEDGNGLGTEYDWNIWTAPQTYLDGSSRPYDMGRGIGGGSLINGMCWTRGGKSDFDAWVALGNPGWGWADLLPYFKKAENYNDNVDAEFSRELYISPNLSNYGSNGYVHVSYPKYFYNQSQLFLEGLQELGIPILTDPNNGTAAGGMLIPNSLDPDQQTRSSARTAYYNGFIDSRPNFHVATGQFAVRLIADGHSHGDGLWISGVEFITDGSLAIRKVSAGREVILAAGSIHTPQILELSGIGQADVLEEFGIPVKINLPGVGNNLQDHPYVGVVYFVSNSSYITLTRNSSLFNQSSQDYYVNKTGPWTAGAINTVAFPSLQSISLNFTAMITDALTQETTQFLPSGLDPTVIAGYAAQKALLVELLSDPDVGAYEILNDNVGLLAVSAMHPFSRGSVHIQSSSPLLQPEINPRYCSNPLDCQVLVEALLFNNKLINTNAMRPLDQESFFPFLRDATPDTLMPAIRSGIRTEFHATGTTSMLPLELGGVVDIHLRVYGTNNLRVVDAGVIPLVPAAHLQAPVYAIAEKAADIIKADNKVLGPHSCYVDFGFPPPGPVFSNSTSNNTQSNASATFSNFPQFLNSSFNQTTITPNATSQNTANTFTNGSASQIPVFTLVKSPKPMTDAIAMAASLILPGTLSMASRS